MQPAWGNGKNRDNCAGEPIPPVWLSSSAGNASGVQLQCHERRRAHVVAVYGDVGHRRVQVACAHDVGAEAIRLGADLRQQPARHRVRPGCTIPDDASCSSAAVASMNL